MRDKFFYFGLLGFALGIFFRSFYDFGAIFWQFLIFLAGAILVASFILKNFRQVTLAIFILAAGLGIWRFDFSADKEISPALENHVGQIVLFEGLISAEPDERENNTKLTIDIASTTGKILATVASYPKFSYGDKVKLRGILEKPKNFNEPDDLRQFDYISYLAKDGNHKLGLVAEKDIIFTRDVPEYFDLHAAVLAQNGRTIRHHYNKQGCREQGQGQDSQKNEFNFYGSLISNQRSYWNFSSGQGSPASGFVKTTLDYDPTNFGDPPPYFPSYGAYQFLSWKEVKSN